MHMYVACNNVIANVAKALHKGGNKVANNLVNKAVATLYKHDLLYGGLLLEV